MISFKRIDAWDTEGLTRALGQSADWDAEYLSEVFDAFSDVAEQTGTEVALAVCGGCLAVRIFDGGRYVFPFPVELGEGSDIRAACRAVAEYTRRELLPLYFSDVPREALSLLGELFSHIDARAYCDDEDLFGVLVNTECGLLDCAPSVTHRGVTLDGITEADREAYASLCSDRELNKWWGYDADADNPDGDPDFYLRVVRDELAAGVALALAVRCDGVFAGEAVVYDFDYTGSASVGIRVLTDLQGRGVGSRAFEALILLCREIGLCRIGTSVMKENTPSVRMTDKYMSRAGESDGKILYSLDL